MTTVELATVEDAELILELQKLAYLSEARLYNDLAIPPLLQTLEGIRSDMESQVFLKAMVNGRIVGSVRARLDRETCLIGRLAVHPDFQRRGIGTRLMGEVEIRFGAAGRFELFTGHRSEGNIRLYRKLGYRAFRSERVSANLELVYMEKPGGRRSDGTTRPSRAAGSKP